MSVFECGTDLLSRMAKVFNAQFLEIFTHLYPILFAYTNDQHDVEDHIEIVGSFAEIFKYDPLSLN